MQLIIHCFYPESSVWNPLPGMRPESPLSRCDDSESDGIVDCRNPGEWRKDSPLTRWSNWNALELKPSDKNRGILER